jgi:malate dehydrogenase (oxaloacetate-decarboxylating)
MEEWEVFVNEAVAVAKKAIEQGVARRILSESELETQAERMIRRAREEVKILMKSGLIPPLPKV